MDTKFDMNEWRSIKDKLRNKYPELTNADLNWGRFSRNELIEIISNKLGKTQNDLIDEIESY